MIHSRKRNILHTYQPHKKVKQTQTIRRQSDDELFECV